jgi:uncharacterized protein with von Willebrand factor type A (vWA) domain
VSAGDDLAPLSRRVLLVDAWDEARFDAIMAELDVLAANGEALTTLAPETGAELWADMFAAFDQPTPRLVAATDLDGDFTTNYVVISALVTLPEFARLRASTTADAYASAIACCWLRTTVEVIYDRHRTMERARKAAEAARAADQPAADEQAEDDAAAGQRTLLLRAAMAKAAEHAEEDAAQAAMVLPGAAGELRRLPAARRLALAQRLNHRRFRRMADVFGAMEALLAGARRNRVPGAPTDTGQIEYGRDITRALPSALLLAGDDDYDQVFMDDYARGRLAMVERLGEQEASRGGIICCCDSSISMAEPEGAPNEERAKAMALALLHQCRRQRRPFHGIHFADRWRTGPDKGKPQLLEYDFSGAYDVERVLDFAEVFIGGYTSFVFPLDRGAALLEAEYDTQGRTDGDLVMITDGEASVGDEWAQEWIARMKRVDARCWGLLCEGAEREPLESLCRATGGAVATYAQITDPDVDLRAVLAGLSR